MSGERARLWLVAAFAVMVTSGGAAPPPAAPEMHNYLTIAGVRYVVATLGERVRVTADPAPADRSAESREAMRQAVIEATGCVIIDDRWSEYALIGELDCRDRRPWKIR